MATPISTTAEVTTPSGFKNLQGLRRLRMTHITHAKMQELAKQNLPCSGLREMNASASGQFSRTQLEGLIQAFKTKKTIFVDVRRESHGYAKGDGKLDSREGNEGLTAEQIIESEKKWVKEQGRETEQELVNEISRRFNADVTYVRLPVTDHHPLTSADVDRLIMLFKTDKLQWIHFHCRKGGGRATSAMSLLDTWKNAKLGISPEQIIARQFLIGGSDLTKKHPDEPERDRHAKERLQLIQDVWSYCRSGFSGSFSEWMKENFLSEESQKECVVMDSLKNEKPVIVIDKQSKSSGRLL